MRFCVVGLSHRTAPIELRERFAQNTQDLEQTLQAMGDLENIDEACIISTCNRVEFYASGSADPATLSRAVRNYLQGFSGISPDQLAPHLYFYEGVEALRHLFRVSSSLDSMVLGEPQILGQVKEAFRVANEHGVMGTILRKVFQRSFAVAKRVRTETGIAENAVSMSFAAVELGREIFDSLEGKQVLLVGAGKMATLAAKHLKAYGVSQVRVASRSIQTAERLADEIGGLASSLSDLSMLLQNADIVISSTAAPTYVVDKKMMSRVVRARRYKPILFVDIAVPRDVHPDVADLDNVFVYDVDDLEAVLELNRETRAKEADAAETMVRDELDSFLRWSKSQEVVPVIKALRAHAGRVASYEVQRTLQNIRSPDKKTEQSIRAMGQAIVNKMLHPVMTRLKSEGAQGDPDALIQALTALFDLDLIPTEPAEGTAEDRSEEGANVVQLRQNERG